MRDAQTPDVAAVERLGFARIGNLRREQAAFTALALSLSGLAAGSTVDGGDGVIAGSDQFIVCIGIALDEHDQPEAIIG